MTSSFVPPTLSQYDASIAATESPSQRSRLVFPELPAPPPLPPNEPLQDSSSAPLLLTLPAASREADDVESQWDLSAIHGVSVAPPLLCAATMQAVHVYRVAPSLDILSTAASSSATLQKSVLLARWTVPPDVSVRAAVLAPNSSVLAVLTCGVSETAALALLSPATCSRRIRLALPPPLASAICLMNTTETNRPIHDALRQESITFFSASDETLASAPLPMDIMPSRLRRVFPMRLTPPEIKEDPAPWGIAISANGAAFMQVFIFHRGYRRLHHQAFLSLPHVFSDSRLVVHSALTLHPHKLSTFIAAATTSSVFIAKGVSFDEVITQSDVPISTLAAVAHSTNISFCTRANGAFALAVHAGPTLHIYSTPVRAADVRAVRLVIPVVKQGYALVVALMHDGIPRVIARIIAKNETFPQIIPLESPGFQNHNLHPGRWPCVPTTPAAISMHESIVTAAFVSDGQIVVRFLDCSTFLLDTSP